MRWSPLGNPLGTCKCTPKVRMFILYLSLLARWWQSSSSLSWIFRCIYECPNTLFPSETRCRADALVVLLKLYCTFSPPLSFAFFSSLRMYTPTWVMILVIWTDWWLYECAWLDMLLCVGVGVFLHRSLRTSTKALTSFSGEFKIGVWSKHNSIERWREQFWWHCHMTRKIEVLTFRYPVMSCSLILVSQFFTIFGGMMFIMIGVFVCVCALC